MGRPPNISGQRHAVRRPSAGLHRHPDHPLVGKLDISKEELAKQKFIVRERGSGTRSSFEFFMSDSLGDLRYSDDRRKWIPTKPSSRR
jgi:DNA-binding transcriptional LysR family regulator